MVGLTGSWWQPERKEDIHSAVFQFLEHLAQTQQHIAADNVRHLSLYTNRHYGTGMAPGALLSADDGANQAIRLNMTKSAIDTISAKISTQKVRPMILSSGGRWKLRLRARKLQRFIEGIFYENKVHKSARKCLKDALVFGTGFMKTYVEKDRIKLERVLTTEITVDDSASVSCPPRSLFQTKQISAELLLAQFPDAADEIKKVGTFRDGDARRQTQMIEVVEAWHLPSDENAKDGRHVIVIRDKTLLDESWDYDWFPFVEIRFGERPTGFFGSGACEDLHGLQREINYLLIKIQKSMHLNANAWLLKHVSDDTSNDQFTNKDGTIIKWNGNHPPTLQVHPAQHQQVFEYLWNLYRTGFQDVGVSEMSATSRKPPGIESGRALQTMLDVETQRFATLSLCWEEFFVDLSDRIIELARDTYTEKGYKVVWQSRNYIETIDWTDVNMEKDQFVLKVWPTNLLPQTPVGKIDMLDRIMQMGLIDPAQGMALLDFPDLEAYLSLSAAAVENIEWIVDQVVYEEKWVQPREFHMLPEAIKRMQLAALKAQSEGAPEEVLARCVQWMEAARETLQRLAPEPPTEMMPPELSGISGGLPMPPGDMGGMMPPGMPPGMPPQEIMPAVPPA